MRVVIDTNIWISGLLWRGKAWSLLKLAEKGEIEICVAYPMLLELEEVLAYERLKPRLEVLEETPAQLTAFALSLSTPFDVSRTGMPIVTADSDDDIFLLCALEAQAVAVVTNDRHLLTLQTYQGIPILTLDKFFESYVTDLRLA
jgi:hypothetical protein